MANIATRHSLPVNSNVMSTAPISLSLTSIAHGGEAIGQHAGKIIFVPYAIPGETVTVELTEEKPRWARARLLTVVTPSDDRVTPPCPYFGPGQCGGCQWQHITYERQLALKAEVVADQLRRLGGIAEPPVLEPIALADDAGLLDFGYRNHVQLTADAAGGLGYVRDGVGQGQPRSTPNDDILAVERCLLLHPLLDEMHAALQATPVENELLDEPEDPAEPPVTVRRVSLRAGINTDQRLLAFETIGDRAPNFVIEDLPVRAVIRRRDGDFQPLIGDPWLEEQVAERVFRVSAASFFQVNTVGAEVMVALATEMLDLHGHEILLDGYCGVGLFGLSLAGQVGQVIGIEESPSACEDFAWNARDLDNVTLHEGPVAEVLATLDGPEDATTGPRLDIALIDPPRSGAGPEVVAQLARLRTAKLLYISCDPATLARDAKLLLQAGYRLVQVQPVDLFPQTYHIESMALFVRA